MAAVIADHFDASWVIQSFALTNRSRQSCHIGVRMLLEQLSDHVDSRPRDFGFITLNIDKRIDLRMLLSNDGDSVRSAGQFRVGQHGLATKCLHFGLQALTVDRDDDAAGRAAARAASYVCCKTVLPVSRNRSFSGNRVDARRAGMTI